MEKTNVIIRFDYRFYTNDITQAVAFCRHCDPKAEGGHSATLFCIENPKNKTDAYAKFRKAKENIKFCPHCGKPVDWNDIHETRGTTM